MKHTQKNITSKQIRLEEFTKNSSTQWRVIPGTNGNYYASEQGEILSLYHKEPRVLKPYTYGKDGYFFVKIKNKNKRVHRLVAKAFIENPQGLPIVHHKDNNKQNNCVSNL